MHLETDNGIHPGPLIVVTFALMAMGLVMVTSATAPLDVAFWDVAPWRTVFGRQAIFIAIGIVSMLLAARLALPVLDRPRWRRQLPLVLFVIALALLAVVLHPGIAGELRGSQRWLRFGPESVRLGFQPSELAKLAMVAALASLLAERGADPRSFHRGFLPAALAVGVTVGLIGKEDFGTSLIIAGVGGMMLFAAGCRWIHLLLMGSLGACGMSVLLIMAPYRMARLTAFRDIWSDPRGDGYQPVQSLATIASGGWLGKGLGTGVQKYGYLPEGHTDFIFSVIWEETGIVGGGLIIGLVCAFVWLGLRTMWHARTPFERLLATGITATIGLQAALNIAVVTVTTPTTGVSLPFVSAGGSGLIMFCIAVGVLIAIARRSGREEVRTRSPAGAATPCAPGTLGLFGQTLGA
ncbi:MAG: cell division protein FtsW [Planctomycetes bacterium]|nr:cell division protein FtsW [Planctomycetota bacterium]